MIENNTEIAIESQQLSQLYQLQNILIEIQKNLELLQSGGTGKTITISGGNLFQLASKYYNDATQWTVIAKANGLTDPEILPGNPITLTIPSVPPSSTGGILTS